jgi:hypothetical protein
MVKAGEGGRIAEADAGVRALASVALDAARGLG